MRTLCGNRFVFAYFLCALLLGLVVSSAPAHAADITDVADAFDKENNNPFDLRIQISYELLSQSANIYREKAHPTEQYFCYGAENGCTNYPEFGISHFRHTMNLRLAVGLFKDLELFLNVPLVIYESVFSTITPEARQSGSSLLSEGIVQAEQMESRHTSVFGDMSLGFRWAPSNDYRDPTTSTWVLGLHWTFPTGAVWNPLTLKPDAQNGNILTDGGVGSGMHRLTLSFAWSKRMMFADPYIRVQIHLSLASDEQLREGLLDPAWLSAQRSLVQVLQGEALKATTQEARERFTRLANDKQSYISKAIQNSITLLYQAELAMGSEFVFYENTMRNIKIALDTRFVIFGTFQGRSPVLFQDMMANYRPTGTERGVQVPLRASLITDHEAFFTIYFQPALSFKLGKYAYIRIEGKFGTTLPFLFTRAQRGTDDNKNGFVDLQTDEVYPYHTRNLDGVGKRLQQRDSVLASFLFHAGLTF